MSRRPLSAPPAALPMGATSDPRRKFWSTLLMLASTAVMLPLLFPPFYCFFFGPVALVPFCVCVLRRPLRKRYLLAYYLTGVAFFLPNLFWLAPVDAFGFIALALFVALYFVLFAIGLNRLVVQLRLPATLAVPLVWTAVEYLRATFVLGGFPWFLLGNSLTPMPVLIQAADLCGVWGLTFLLAMLNGFVVDFLRLPLRQVVKGKGSRFSPQIGRLIAAVSVLVAAYLGYGIFRLSQHTTRPGPRIAVIQENIPQSAKESGSHDAEILEKHLRLSLEAARANPQPDLIAWPETMVPGFGNREFLEADKKAFDSFREEPGFWPWYQEQTLKNLATLERVVDQTRIPLLIGMGSLDPRKDFGDSLKQNRTILQAPGAGRVAYYAKVHLVPFGEYIPFRSVPWLGPLMLSLSPMHDEQGNPEDFSDIPGTEWTRFALPVAAYRPAGAVWKLNPDAAVYTFATPICFEDVMPEPARQMSAPQYANGRKADFLINVSNDGWFHWVELDQHLQASQLRAVENRIPIARSVNTGNSGFIDSNGRIIKLVHDAQGNSIGAVGTDSCVLEIDARVTFFSRIGDLFPIICGILATLLVGWTLVRPRRANPAAGTSETAESA